MTKFCKDCIHFAKDNYSHELTARLRVSNIKTNVVFHEPTVCLRVSDIKIDTVYGDRIINPTSCIKERDNNNGCGPDAKYFAEAPLYKRIWR